MNRHSAPARALAGSLLAGLILLSLAGCETTSSAPATASGPKLVEGATAPVNPAIYAEAGAEWPGHNLRIAGVPKSYQPRYADAYDPASGNSLLLLFVRDPKSGINLEANAQRLGVDVGVGREDLDAVFRERSRESGLSFRETRDLQVGDFHWAVYVKEDANRGRRTYDVNFRGIRNGVIYTNLVWAYQSDSSLEAVVEAAESFMERFALMDADRYVYSPSYRETESVVHSSVGVSLDLSGLGFAAQFDADSGETLHYDPARSAVLLVRSRPLEPGPLSIGECVAGFESLSQIAFSSEPGARRQTIPGADRETLQFVAPLGAEAANWAVTRLVIKGRTGALLRYVAFGADRDLAVERLETIASRLEFGEADPQAEPPKLEAAYAARFASGIGGYHFARSNFRKAAERFRSARDAEPEVEVHLKNLVHALAFDGQFEETLKSCAIGAELAPRDPLYPWMAGRSYFQLGRIDEGIAAFRRLFFEIEANDDTALQEYFSNLYGNGRLSELVADLGQLKDDSRDSSVIDYWQALALRESGALDAALEIAMALLEQEPENVLVGTLAADILIKDDRAAEALELCERLLERSGSPQLHYMIGLSYTSLQRYAAARDAFSACLQAFPGHADARAMLNHLRSILGESDPSLYSSPVEEVPMSPHWERQPSVANEEALRRKGAYADYSGYAIHYRRGRPQRRTYHARFVVTNESQSQEIKEMSFEFNPDFERVFVNRAQVFDLSGKLVGEGDPSQYYVSDRGKSAVVDNGKTLHVVLPNVTKGVAVEIAVSFETNGPVDDMLLQTHSLTGRYPRRFAFVQLTGDLDQTRYAVNRDDIAWRSEPDVQLWHVNSPPTPENLDFLPLPVEYLPFVWIGAATDADWEALASSYYAEIEDRLGPPDEAALAIASSLPLGGDGVADKVEAVMEYINDHYSYRALAFGQRARIPNTLQTILGNKFGDCKDHVVLSRALLVGLGVEAHPALVHSQRVTHPDLPSLDQFDHMILYVPELGDNGYIDPTDRFHSARLRPRWLGGATALVLQPERPFLGRIAAYGAEDSRMKIDRSVSILEYEDALVQERVEAHGIAAAQFREILYNTPEEERSVVVQQFLRQAVPTIALQGFKASGLDELSGPVVLDYSYRAERSFIRSGDRIQGRSPASWDQLFYLHDQSASEPRRAPYRVLHPISIELSLQIDAPEGYGIAEEAMLGNRSFASDFGIAERHGLASARSGAGRVQLAQSLELREGLYPVERAGEFRQHMKSAIELLTPTIVFARQP